MTLGNLLTIATVIFSGGVLVGSLRSLSRRVSQLEERVENLDHYIRNGDLERRFITRREHNAMEGRKE